MPVKRHTVDSCFYEASFTLVVRAALEPEVGSMATKGRPFDIEAWRNAKKICRLSARQVEMARALGMNPKKLPSLRPSPQQRWKLPVGEFIEACYWKRFGGDPLDRQPCKPEPASSRLLTGQQDQDALKRVRDASWPVGDLVCYLMNLADNLKAWLAQGMVAPEVLPQVIRELREIAEALETGAPVSPIPAIPQSPHPARRAFSQRENWEPQSDDDIPF